MLPCPRKILKSESSNSVTLLVIPLFCEHNAKWEADAEFLKFIWVFISDVEQIIQLFFIFFFLCSTLNHLSCPSLNILCKIREMVTVQPRKLRVLMKMIPIVQDTKVFLIKTRGKFKMKSWLQVQVIPRKISFYKKKKEYLVTKNSRVVTFYSWHSTVEENWRHIILSLREIAEMSYWRKEKNTLQN